MSIPKISGQQARELLDIWSGDVEGLTFAQLGADRSYGDLFGAAPALAETVAWLYGRPSDETVPGDEHWDTEGFLVEVRDGRVAMFDDEATTTYLSVDQTVDLARALLAAAEEARP